MKPAVASLTLRDIRKKLGGNPILRGIDLDVADGELLVLVGPSGCGKSTLLRTIAGLELPDAGAVRIGDRDVTRAAPRERDVAMVFPSYALYPHLTVRQNLAFGLELRHTDRATIDARIAEVSKMLGLEPLLGRYPREMSGGQRQRVAMGRAIARRPALFLFDEPLSNLDAALRSEVRVEIKRLHQQLGTTIVYVTHDQVEAMTLADRIVVMRAGAIEQLGAPLEVYGRPATKFVAAFLGSPSMNFLPARIENGHVRAEGVNVRVQGAPEDRSVLAGIRPHDVALAPAGSSGLSMHVDVVEAMGFETYAHGKIGGETFCARLEGVATVHPGDDLELAVAPDACHLFDPVTERAL